MKKKIIRVLTFLFIAILGIVLIKTGLYFQKLSSPKHIYKEGIEIVSVRLEDLFKIDNKYQFGDDFKVNGSIENVSAHFRDLVIEAATVACT